MKRALPGRLDVRSIRRILALFVAALAVFACIAPNRPEPKVIPQTPAPKAGSIVLGYSASWIDGAYPPSAYDYKSLTHIARSFLNPKPDGTIVESGGFWNPDLERLAKQHNVKLLAAIGGAAENADHWLGMARNPEAKKRFFDGLEKLITEHKYDGVDIDWEPSALTDADQQTFTEFMLDLRARFPKWIITTALGPSDWWARHISWKEVSASVDFINLMTYVFAGPWSGHSGHNANLFPAAAYKDPNPIDVKGSIENLINKYGVPPSKIALGLAFYGTQFSTDKLGDTFPADAIYKGTEISLTDIAPLLESSDYKKLWDDGAHAPYLERIGGGHTVSYDDERSTADKCALAQKMGLAGVMIWYVGGDAIRGRTPLMTTVGKSFGRSPSEPDPAYIRQFFELRVREAKKLADDFERQRVELAKLSASAADKYSDVPKPSDISDQIPDVPAELDSKLREVDGTLARLKTAIFRIGGELESLPISLRKGRTVDIPGASVLLGDFESGKLDNALGGIWEASSDPHDLGTTQSPRPFAASAGGRGNSKHSLRIWGHFGKSQAPWPYADIRATFENTDFTPFSSVRFWTKGDGKTYHLALVRSAVRDYAYPRATFTAPREWTQVELKLDDFKQPTWGKPISPGRFDVIGLSFQPGAQFNDEPYDLAIDDVELVRAAP